jgi:hypothetical protein
MEEENETPIIEQKESIKLTKNAKGNYQWEIKILSLDINQLEKLNKEMNEKFSDGISTAHN